MELDELKYLVKTEDGKPFTGYACFWEESDRETYVLYESIKKGFCFTKGQQLKYYGKCLKTSYPWSCGAYFENGKFIKFEE